MTSQRNLESAAYDPIAYTKMAIANRFERLKKVFRIGNTEGATGQIINMLGIDGTVVMIPVEEERSSPVPGWSTVTVDNTDGTPGTRFWVRARDADEGSMLISAEDVLPRGGDDYVL